MENMTERQQRFCDEYLISLNATQAAIKAGYSKKYAGQNADKLLKNTKIKKFLEDRLKEKEDALIAKQDEVMKYLTSVMRREKAENVVVTISEKRSFYAPDENGTMRKNTEEKETPLIVEIPARLSDANKAAELLGKAYGIYTDRIEQEVDMELSITVDYGDGNEN